MIVLLYIATFSYWECFTDYYVCVACVICDVSFGKPSRLCAYGTFCYGRIWALKSRAIFQATKGQFSILSAAKFWRWKCT